MIHYYQEQVQVSLDSEDEISSWLEKTAIAEDLTIGTLSIIFCSDEFLLNINQKHLQHDYYTDIITFDYSEDRVISGDLFISIDRVKDNASQLNIQFLSELHRVLVHGVLHLCGYQDKNNKDIKVMRSKEDHYLSLRAFI